MLRRFRLEEPETVREVSELLARFGESAKVYAGGTELLLAMKEGFVQYERLINVKKLTGLNEVKLDNGTAHIGALCTHRQLETAPVLQQRLPALVKLEKNVANVRVRQVGTLGGNLCFAEPHADPGILLMALAAKMVAEKSSSKREITAEAFFGDAYLKFGYLERPSVGVAVALTLSDDGKSVGDIKIAVGCAGPAPKSVPESEAILKGKSTDEAVHRLAEAGEVAGRAARAISDLHGSQEYKEHIVGVLLKRAFQNAVSQC